MLKRIILSMWNGKTASKSQIRFLLQNPVLYVIPTESALGRLSLILAGDMGITSVASAMPPPSIQARRAVQRPSLASRQAVPSPSTSAASPTCCCPVPASASLKAPHNRMALSGRYYPGAFCDKEQDSGDGCRLWYLNASVVTRPVEIVLL